MTDIAKALEAVRVYVMKYIVFPSEYEAVAVALWVMHAWKVEFFETSPMLGVTSAEMRSGKTLLLDMLQPIVPHPFRAVTPSEATVFFVLNPHPSRSDDPGDPAGPGVIRRGLAEKWV